MQKSGKEDRTDAGSSFYSAPIMVGTPEALVIPTMHKMPVPMGGLGDFESGGKKTVKWSLCMEE